MKKFKTKQEEFWSTKFGDEYTVRNKGNKIIAGNIAVFSKILTYTHSISSLIEFGAGSGNNLKAIQNLLPDIASTAVEINQSAVKDLKKIKNTIVLPQSILEYKPKKVYDFVLVKGVLIHINPQALKHVYELLYKSTKKYICIMEYYNTTPIEVDYRGHKGYLFKRDFAGEILNKYKDLTLKAYGFTYRGDVNYWFDDITWFLLEKKLN